MYDQMMLKRREVESIGSKMKFKREYDSDEEVDEEGTWEHKIRKAECEATKGKADFNFYAIIYRNTPQIIPRKYQF